MITLLENLEIIPMTKRHTKSVWRIENLCFPHPWSLDSFRMEVTENQCARYFVARLNKRVIGYGGMWLIVDEAHITNIAVHPDYRGMGVGEKILLALMEKAYSLNIESMTLEVRKSNYIAINLYKKLGFKEAGLRRKYYPDNGEDAIIMWNSQIGDFIK